MQKWLKRALDGARQLVFVTGEAGISKTTVVDAFVARLNAKSNVWIGRGLCIDHYGQGEAYLPVLEALGRMCREPEGNQLIDLLAQHAPTWLVQMPALLTTTDLESLQRRTQGTTRERMLRELAEAMEVLTTERPLVLWLEDLQWSDVSTLDWLAFIARRREPARLLILGTYRPVDVIVSDHSLKSVKQELHLHGQCVELPLSFLTEEHVTKYVVRRFAVEVTRASPLRRLTQLIHQRTEGNPLFMVNLVDYVVTQGVLARIEGQWRLQGEVTAVESWAPESLQQLIERQIERLSPTEKRVLEVASVAGAEFSAAAVAAGAGIAVEAVEEHCGELTRQEQLLRTQGTADWPDGTVAARYRFLHALYQEVLYNHLTVRQQQRLHRQIGERVEQAYGERAREIATELAMHFERGREYDKAIQYLRQAGQNANKHSAYVEATGHLTKGLELLQTLPDTPERAQQELSLQMSLGASLQATKGWAAPDVEGAYTRAQELCQQLGETPQLFQTLLGLAAVRLSRAELQTVRELGEQCLSLAQHMHKPALLLKANELLGVTLFNLGELAPARAYLEQGIALYDPQKGRFLVFAGVNLLSMVALALWSLGYPDQALKRSYEALTLAKEQSHLFSLAMASCNAAVLHRLRRERHAAQEQAEAAIALSAEHGFPAYVKVGTTERGWALTEQGQGEEGIAQICQGWAWHVRRPAHLVILAGAYGKVGQTEDGLKVVAEALALVDKNGERYYEAELYWLKGELLLAREDSRLQAIGFRKKTEEAEECFLKAIEVARRQQAKSWELRATISLARLWQKQSKKAEARQMLAEIYGWFTEGFDTKDLQEAKVLLDELSH